MKRFVLVALLVLSGLLILILKNTNTEEKAPSGLTRTRQDEILPYSVEGLRQREYKSEIKTREKVGENASFTTYVISYDSDGLNLFALLSTFFTNTPGKITISGMEAGLMRHGVI